MNDIDNRGPQTGASEPTRVTKRTNTKPKESQRSGQMDLFDWLTCFVIAIVVGILFFVFIGRTIGVDGPSMQQTLQHNDRVVISNLFYSPRNGDVVIFRAPLEMIDDTPIVKRVIAIEGQTLDICGNTGNVIVNGEILHEPYINNTTTRRYYFTGPITIPSGYVFVMGDNRERSIDSRHATVGLVDTRYILGQVNFILTPGVDETGRRDWSRLGLLRY